MLNVDVWLIQAVEEHYSGCTMGIQLLDERHGIGEVFTQFHDDGQFHLLAKHVYNLHLTLFIASVGIIRFGLECHRIDFQCIGTRLLDFLSKLGPAFALVTADTGNHRNGAHLLGRGNQLEIFTQVMVAHILFQIVYTIIISGLLVVHCFHLVQYLFFEKRF